jgi:hypothetical protein
LRIFADFDDGEPTAKEGFQSPPDFCADRPHRTCVSAGMVAVAGIHIAVENQRFWYLEATSEAARPIFPSTHAAN